MLSVARSHPWIQFKDPMRDRYDQSAINSGNPSYHNTFTVEPDNSTESSGEEESSITGSSSKGRSTSRLPPRSRTGCWTCRRRKVKCDEVRPICGQCLRLQQVCDYEPHYEFRYDTNKQRAKRELTGINETESPPWDRTARRHHIPRAAGFDDLPSFQSLTNEEQREKKATFQRPGTYHVIADQNSFASLPEYGGSSSAPSTTTVERSESIPETLRAPRRQASLPDPNIVILERFEPPLDRQPQTTRHSRQNQEQQRGDRPPRSQSQPVIQTLPDPSTFQPPPLQHQQTLPPPRPLYIPQSPSALYNPQTVPQTGPPYAAGYYRAPPLASPVYSPPTPEGYAASAPAFRRAYTQNPVTSAGPYQMPALPSRHLSMSLTHGSGSVLEEISGMRSAGYIMPGPEESIEDWEEELYAHGQ